jgi:uncharacterized membrane protein YccC
MALVVTGGSILFGRPIAMLAAVGALYASIVDQPAPLATKARVFALDIPLATGVALLAGMANGSAWTLLPLIAATSLLTGLAVAYGRRAVGLSMAVVLALLFGMASPAESFALELGRAAVFAGGGVAYAVFALILTAALDGRTRLLALSEAMLAFARYVRAKAALYDPGARPRDALQRLIDAHANLVERLQAARDLIFAGRYTSGRARWVASLLALLEAFDTVLSSDADIETLRASEHRHLMRRLYALIGDLALDAEHLALAAASPTAAVSLPDRAAQLQAIADEIARIERAGEADAAAFRATSRKLAQTVQRLTRLRDAIAADGTAPEIPTGLTLSAFVNVQSTSLKVVRGHLRLSSPVLRYALRLTLAMTAGYGLTLIFPHYIHGGWVLLTTALIMRANYSVTRQRRDDRVLGNLAGCFVTVALVRLLPPDALSACVVVAIAVSHAYSTVDYRVTAFAACISALLQLHFVAPLAQPLLLERVFDTLIGAGLAWGFSYVLPNWERRSLPRLIRAVVKADRDYALLALDRVADQQALRLARKRAHDAAANLSTTARRLSAEPNLDRRALVALQDLLAANYLLASDLASMRVIFRVRAKELEPEPTDALLAATRQTATAAFAIGADKPPPSPRGRSEAPLGGANAAASLKRRLVHIERASERVAALSARALAYCS